MALLRSANYLLNDQALRVGLGNLQPMDSSDAKPGLLNGPISWSLETRAVSAFSEPDCVHMLESDGWCGAALIERARAGIDAVIDTQIGCDCWSPASDDPASSVATILVVAYPIDDAAQPSWARLIAAVARERGRQKAILLVSGQHSKASSHRFAKLAADHDMALIVAPVNERTLLDTVSSVYTLGGDIGFLAMLMGIRVRCFGRPFYAGWGLTEDDALVAPRAVNRSVEEIFAAACLLATHYTDPFTGNACDFEDISAILALWRRINDANRRVAVCIGMSFWKQRRMRDVLRSTDRVPEFHKTTTAAVEAAERRRGAVAVWAAREPADLAATAAAAGVPVIRIEDGFVRSVGLGADFMPAGSVVLDETGIYFDPTKPSDLEHVLETADFGPTLLERSRRLVQTLVKHGITKYNTGAGMPAIDAPDGKQKLFVPGQVENDRSVSLGGAGIYTNIDLLRRVRTLNPDAFILYKPHPDVDAGHRPGAVPDADILRYADHIVRGVSTAAIIPAVDEVHTLTSLAGFEALIRKRKVVVYGQPFYAGWGLTIDMAPIARRRRRLSLEELIAGSLVVYPRYFDPVTRLPCGPEILIERLAHPEIWKPGVLITLRRLQGDIVRHVRSSRSITMSNLGKRRKHVNPA